jgi:hypothetical protein
LLNAAITYTKDERNNHSNWSVFDEAALSSSTKLMQNDARSKLESAQ